MTRILVTGANGFVGSHLVARLRTAGFMVRGAVRTQRRAGSYVNGCEDVVVGDIAGYPEWRTALQDVDMVAHIAGRAHVQDEKQVDALSKYRRANVESTRRLARAASEVGVKRFLYLSSIGVLGDWTADGVFDENTAPCPVAPYAISKLEAEECLRREAGAMEFVIIRPPLVYGPGNPGNFLRLMRLVSSGFPLPFGNIQNCRCLVYVENLVDLLTVCLGSREAAGQTYVVCDGEVVSLPALIEKIGIALGRRTHLISLPVQVLKLLGGLVHKRDLVNKLIGSLVVNSSRVRRELKWTPPFSLDQGIARTASWFLESQNLET